MEAEHKMDPRCTAATDKRKYMQICECVKAIKNEGRL